MTMMSERVERDLSKGEEERAASYIELYWTAVPGQGFLRRQVKSMTSRLTYLTLCLIRS